MEKSVDVTGRYSREIEEIKYILQNIENGRYYENSGARMDGYLSTNITKLRENLRDLIKKIEYNLNSDDEKLANELSNIKEL